MAEEQADVAQLVEQLIRNQQVNGSSPFVGSIRFLQVHLFDWGVEAMFRLNGVLEERRDAGSLPSKGALVASVVWWSVAAVCWAMVCGEARMGRMIGEAWKWTAPLLVGLSLLRVYQKLRTLSVGAYRGGSLD
jgi:hypothetical protein